MGGEIHKREKYTTHIIPYGSKLNRTSQERGFDGNVALCWQVTGEAMEW